MMITVSLALQIWFWLLVYMHLLLGNNTWVYYPHEKFYPYHQESDNCEAVLKIFKYLIGNYVCWFNVVVK
jgi:hypothetical protein